jgi:hypothetical protein
MNSDSNSDKQFEFMIVGGKVVAYFEVENDIREQESIDNRDAFVIDGSQITTLTKRTSNGFEITVFSDPEEDGFYKIVSE